MSTWTSALLKFLAPIFGVMHPDLAILVPIRLAPTLGGMHVLLQVVVWRYMSLGRGVHHLDIHAPPEHALFGFSHGLAPLG